jgi:hypothetical protein
MVIHGFFPSLSYHFRMQVIADDARNIKTDSRHARHPALRR